MPERFFLFLWLFRRLFPLCEKLGNTGKYSFFCKFNTGKNSFIYRFSTGKNSFHHRLSIGKNSLFRKFSTGKIVLML